MSVENFRKKIKKNSSTPLTMCSAFGILLANKKNCSYTLITKLKGVRHMLTHNTHYATFKVRFQVSFLDPHIETKGV